MTKNIFEDLPVRKHAAASAVPAAKEGAKTESGEGGSEKKIRQAVYDIRYRARREGVDLRAAYAQYMQNSNLSAPEQAAVRAKLFGKDGGGAKKEVKEERTAADPGMRGRMGTRYSDRSAEMKAKGKAKIDRLKAHGESYDVMMSDGATGTVASALFKVFVEKVEKEPIQEDEGAERKYKVRVTDPKSDKSYVRYANRSKITELRAKGLKVEMTEHGEPYEGEKKNRGKMDPVAKNPQKRDGDVNNDGKKDGTDKYIYARRDAINAAIAKKKGMSEEFLADGTTSTEGQGTTVPNGPVNNYAGKKPVVQINPESEVGGKNLRAHREVEGEMIAEKSVSKTQQLFMNMIAEKKKSDNCAHTPEGKDCEVHGKVDCSNTVEEQVMNCGCGQNPCITYGEGKEDKKETECSPGETRTYRELLKNKLRAMGIKNPMMLGAPDDGETVMKIMASQTAKMTTEGYGKKKKKKK